MTILKCDFDNPRPPRLTARITIVMRLHGLGVEWVRYDRTRRGWHVSVAVRQRLALMRVVCLQACLGSDWKRETYNARRAVVARHVPLYWRERVNVLYKTHCRGVEL